tara:strand:- start:145 stop:513 length:369 start_codon:yes stop_codon:yes gene_type:complete
MRKVNEKSEPFKALPRSNKFFKIKYLDNYFVKSYFALINFLKRFFGNYYSLAIWSYRANLFYKTTAISCLTIEKNRLICLTLVVIKFKVISLVRKNFVLKIFKAFKNKDVRTFSGGKESYVL